MQNTQLAIQYWLDERKMQTQEIQTSSKSTIYSEYFSTNTHCPKKTNFFLIVWTAYEQVAIEMKLIMQFFQKHLR